MNKQFLAWIVGGFLSFTFFAFVTNPVTPTVTFHGEVGEAAKWITKEAQQGYTVTAMCPYKSPYNEQVFVVMNKD